MMIDNVITLGQFGYLILIEKLRNKIFQLFPRDGAVKADYASAIFGQSITNSSLYCCTAAFCTNRSINYFRKVESDQ